MLALKKKSKQCQIISRHMIQLFILLMKKHLTVSIKKMRHGGFVIRSGNSSKAHKQAMEFSLTLESNPEFTASVLVAYARAAYHLHKKR